MTEAAPPDAPGVGTPRLVRGLVVGTVLGVLVYAGFLLWGDLDAIGEALEDFEVGRLPAVLGLVLLGYGIRFLRWERYRAVLDVHLTRGTSLRIFLAGLALTVTPGKLGEAFKSVLIKEADGTPVTRTAPIVFAERLTDLVGLLLLIAIAGLRTSDHAWIYATTFVVVLVGLAVLASPSLSQGTLRLTTRLPGLAKLATPLGALLDSTRTLLTPRELPRAVLLATIAWGLECVGFLWILKGFGVGAEVVDVPLAVTLFAGPLVLGAVAVFTPGGLGVTEGTMTALVVGAGVARSIAVSATLVARLCTLWFAMGVGLVALAWHRRMRARATA